MTDTSGGMLIDTNIALYLLSGDETIAEILDKTNVYISVISELELLGYQDITNGEKEKIKEFIKDCIIIELNEAIKTLTIDLKQSIKIKLPDAIIAATAMYLNIPLISADIGFEKINEIQFIKYEKI
jgi:predicted nucleic acid-binding protein